ncbi:hypothetical protein DEU38_105150 [Rhodococcus sp. AG1013]|nr:hypothetical protein DEU38_105150 [Rhodococcus sp. AG1013]
MTGWGLTPALSPISDKSALLLPRSMIHLKQRGIAAFVTLTASLA